MNISQLVMGPRSVLVTTAALLLFVVDVCNLDRTNSNGAADERMSEEGEEKNCKQSSVQPSVYQRTR